MVSRSSIRPAPSGFPPVPWGRSFRDYSSRFFSGTDWWKWTDYGHRLLPCMGTLFRPLFHYCFCFLRMFLFSNYVSIQPHGSELD